MNEKQPFVPDEWILSRVDQDNSPYDGSAIYVSPDNKCYKAPLTESALHIIQKYPKLMDYREMTHMIVDLHLQVYSDFEAFIAGQILSMRIFEENVEQNNKMIDYIVDAKSLEKTSAAFKKYYEDSQSELAAEKVRLTDAANQPEFVQELIKEKNLRADLQFSNNELNNQVNELKTENTKLKNEIKEWEKFKEDVEKGTVGHYIDEYNIMKDKLTREHGDKVNSINIEHTKEVNELNNQIYDLNKQVNNLTLQVEQLQETSKRKMDKFLARNKLKCISNASDITTTKQELLKFVDGVLGIFDNAIDGINNIATAVKKANFDVLKVTEGVLNIMPLFENISIPKFDVAKEEALKFKNKMENKYNVEEQYLKDFIDKGKLPNIRIDEDEQPPK